MTRPHRLLPVTFWAVCAGCIPCCLAGCAPPPPTTANTPLPSAFRPKARAGEAAPKSAEPPPAQVRTRDSKIRVDEPDGRPLLEAQVGEVKGALSSGGAKTGNMEMKSARCKLYQQGKPNMDLEADQATWDNAVLRAEANVRGVTADGKTVVHAQHADWMSKSGELRLQRVRMEARENGKTTFTVEGPVATILNKVVRMPEGAVAVTSDGRRLKADRVVWQLSSGKIEADGAVTMSDTQSRLTCRSLRADTKLKRTHLQGDVRVYLAPGALDRAGARRRDGGGPSRSKS